MYKAFFKRFLDIVLSLCGIIVLLPVFIIIAVAIVIDDPGAIFFRQKRVGKNKKLFKILKFRSMKMSTPHDMPTHMLENPEQYITKVGKFLRKTSLDELPQIFNIFAGERGIIETTKKNADFSWLSRLIQFRYEVLCEAGKGGKQPLESQNGFLIAYFDPI